VRETQKRNVVLGLRTVRFDRFAPRAANHLSRISEVRQKMEAEYNIPGPGSIVASLESAMSVCGDLAILRVTLHTSEG
jgi:hypothetical protein